MVRAQLGSGSSPAFFFSRECSRPRSQLLLPRIVDCHNAYKIEAAVRSGLDSHAGATSGLVDAVAVPKEPLPDQAELVELWMLVSRWTALGASGGV